MVPVVSVGIVPPVGPVDGVETVIATEIELTAPAWSLNDTETLSETAVDPAV